MLFKKITLQEFLKYFAFFILSCIVIYLAVTTVFVTCDWKTNFLSINPEPKPDNIIRHLDVPIIEPVSSITRTNEESNKGQWISADIALVYKGILAEKTPAELHGIAQIYPDGQAQNISHVIFGIECAKPSNTDPTTPNAQGYLPHEINHESRIQYY